MSTLEILRPDKSILVREEQPQNILDISFTLDVLNLEMSILLKEEQCRNIPPICSTLRVLNPDKSILVRDLQFSNIIVMLFTFVVLRFSIPLIDVSLSNEQNQLNVETGLNIANDLLKTTFVMG